MLAYQEHYFVEILLKNQIEYQLGPTQPTLITGYVFSWKKHIDKKKMNTLWDYISFHKMDEPCLIQSHNYHHHKNFLHK